MKRILAFLFVALAFSASADPLPTVVGVHMFSHHVQSGRNAQGSMGWNNFNPGIYARWNNGLTLGTYKNSLYRRSVYAGYTMEDSSKTFALTLGVVSGYDKMTDAAHADHTAVRCEATCRMVNLKDVWTPLIVPSVRIPLTERVSARLSFLLPPGQPMAAHLSAEYRF